MGWNMCVVTVRAGVVLAACVLVLDMARPAPVHGGDQPRSRWWLNPAVQQELGLTKAQVQALQRTFERGLLVLGAGESAIRLSPPLTIARDQADFALEVLEDCLNE